MASLNRLTLYNGINPNILGNQYFVYDDPSYFYTNLLSSYKVAVIDEPNYRINNGIVIISASDPVTEGVTSYDVLRSITYICEMRTDKIAGGYSFFFYHVEKVYLQADKCYMNVIPDKFANGIAGVTCTKAQVTRLNRIYENGEYPCRIDAPSYLPAVFSGNVTNTPIADNISNMVCIAQVRFVNNADFFGNSPISNTLNFVYKAGNVIPQIMHLGCIYKVSCKKNSSGDRYEGKAQLVQAWMVPSAFLPDVSTIDPTGIYIAYFKDLTDDYSDKQLSSGTAYPHQQQVTYTYKYNLEQEIGKQYYIGTRGCYISVPHQLPRTQIGIETTLNSNGLKVLLRIGEQVTDITGQFALRVTYNNETATDSENIIGGLKTLTGVMSGLSKTYEKSGSMGVAYSIYGKFLDQYNFAEPQPTIGDGDGDLTFEYDSANSNYKFPIRVAAMNIHGSIANDAYINGAATNIALRFISGSKTTFRTFLKSLPNYADLNGSTSSSATYIKADVTLYGRPKEELDAIKAAFAEGINFRYVTNE